MYYVYNDIYQPNYFQYFTLGLTAGIGVSLTGFLLILGISQAFSLFKEVKQ